MENLRFYEEETSGCKEFAKKLSEFGDIYVNDAFGAAHRKHASTAIIADFFPNKKCSGLLLNKEIMAIEKVLETGERPVVAILGGAKVSSKITIINNIFKKVDAIILGGGMAYTFIKAQGGEIGNSICEDDKIDLALELIERAKENNVALHLPTDVVAADNFNNEANRKELQIFNISAGWQGLDIGPASIKAFSKVIINAKTILWNGPMGVFEMSNFSNGTKSIGDAIKISTKNGAYSLVGGGDSVSAVKEFGLDKDVSYVSTGGGAMLESLEGKTLPGIAAL
jgi:phosphoglycerate kinase